MVYLSLYVLLIILNTEAAAMAEPRRSNSPCPQQCVCSYDNTSSHSSSQRPSEAGTSYGHVTDKTVTCAGENLASALRDLPADITNLTYVVTDFSDLNVTFTAFPKLRGLYIKWNLETSAVNIREKNELHKFSNPETFSGLHDLRTLSINVPTDHLHGQLFLDLVALEELDLTNTSALTTNKFADVHAASKLSEKPLKALTLQRIAGIASSEHGQFQMEELFHLLENSSVRHLDISNNGAIFLYPGLIKYLPGLDTYKLGGNEYKYEVDNARLRCAIIEIYIHPKLRILDLSDPINLSKEVARLRIPGHTCRRHPHGNVSCVCEQFNAVCGPMVGDTSCDLLPTFTPDDVYDDTCYANYRIPLYAPRLERLNARNVQVGYAPRTEDTDKPRCYYTNRLKVLDYSRIRIPTDSKDSTKHHENWTILGLDHLEEFILRESEWGYYLQNINFFHSMPALRRIDAANTVAGSYISQDEAGIIFSKSANLEELILTHSNLTRLPDMVFTSLSNLQVLDVSKNELTSVTFDVSNMTSLRRLNLSRNRFTYLTSDFTKRLDRIASDHELVLDLRRNRLTCLCNDSDFLTWMKTTNVTFTCAPRCLSQLGGAAMRKIDTIDLEEFHYQCSKQKTIMISTMSAIGLLIVVAIVVIVLFVRHRKRMNKFNKYGTSKIDPETMRLTCAYDAFIVYADEDRQWVHSDLLYNVETNMGLKVCIHFRDFIPGHNIEEQITECINSSYKTIIVVSKHFLQSHWCDFEMQTARSRLFNEGYDVILPIILSDLPGDAEMSGTLHNVLNTTTYLEWTRGEEGEKQFWQRLAEALKATWVNPDNHSQDALSYDKITTVVAEDYSSHHKLNGINNNPSDTTEEQQTTHFLDLM